MGPADPARLSSVSSSLAEAARATSENRAFDGAGRTLRVGCVVDGTTVPAWAERLMTSLAAADFAQPVLLVVCPPRASRGRNAWWLHAYARLDRMLFTDGPDPLQPVAIPQLDADAKIVQASLTAEGRLDDATDRALEAADLDVVVVLGAEPSAIPPGRARYGVWWLRFGDAERDELAGFSEMHASTTVAIRLLVRLDDDGPPRAAYVSHSRTHQSSLRRTRSSALWRSVDLPLRRLRDLHAGRWSPSEAEAVPAAARSGTELRPRAVRDGAAVVWHVAQQRLRRALVREAWAVACRPRTGASVSQREGPPFALLEAPRGRAFADPFVIEREGRNFLFVEDESLATGKGCISVMELDPAGRPSEPTRVLEAEHHLSYPFVFEQDGEMWMVPESSGDRAITLYRATDFPLGWQPERTLIAGIPAVDPTIVRHDGSYWLFATLADDSTGGSDELHIFSASTLLSDWTPHPGNPVVSDVRRARPAGRIFGSDGQLIRPGQDSSVRYGSAITLCRIDELTPDRYRETPVGRIEPDWLPDIAATHTFNFNAAFEVRDAVVPRGRSRGRGRPGSAGARPPTGSERERPEVPA